MFRVRTNRLVERGLGMQILICHVPASLGDRGLLMLAGQLRGKSQGGDETEQTKGCGT